MSINKNFVIKHGLEVDTNLILADAQTNKVGIGTTAPQYQLDVAGGIGAEDIFISGVGTFTAGAGITLTGTEFSVDVTPTSGSASLTNTGGAVEVKTNTNDGLEVTASGLGINNGTGLTFAAGALVFDTANGYGTRKLAFNVGDGAATSYAVTHSLATRDLSVHVYENASPYAQVEADVEHTDSNNLTVKFSVAPTSNQYRVVVVG